MLGSLTKLIRATYYSRKTVASSRRSPDKALRRAQLILECLEDRCLPSNMLLAGLWNINGLPTQIQQAGSALTFTNERGQKSAGYVKSPSLVVATGWGNLTGFVSGNADQYTITWANNTIWQEGPGQVPNLVGAWNINGLPTQVQQSGPVLTFTNERGQSSAGYFKSPSLVVATGWGNLTGFVSGSAGQYTITWANNTVWQEGPAQVPILPRDWNYNGKPTQVQQRGPVLTFTNERGQKSVGYFISPSLVVASGWGNLIGFISGSAGQYTITWANNAIWQE